MPKMRQCAFDSYREDRAEGRSAVLGVFGISQVQNHTEPLVRGHTTSPVPGVAMSVPTYDQFIEPILRYLAATPEDTTAREAHEAAADALNLP